MTESSTAPFVSASAASAHATSSAPAARVAPAGVRILVTNRKLAAASGPTAAVARPKAMHPMARRATTPSDRSALPSIASGALAPARGVPAQ